MIGARAISLFFLFAGIIILAQVSLPLVSFKIWELSFTKSNMPLVSPTSPQVRGISVQRTETNFPAIISTIERKTPSPFSQFYISISALKIEKASVFVDNNDLAKGLIHLPGSALPGEKGNVFISGHSSLPLLLGRSISKAIFVNLQKLQKGDQVKVFLGNTEFTYQILNLKIVDPNDLSVIAPPDFSERYLTLMTCIPPGLNTKRLVVLGKLI